MIRCNANEIVLFGAAGASEHRLSGTIKDSSEGNEIGGPQEFKAEAMHVSTTKKSIITAAREGRLKRIFAGSGSRFQEDMDALFAIRLCFRVGSVSNIRTRQVVHKNGISPRRLFDAYL